MTTMAARKPGEVPRALSRARRIVALYGGDHPVAIHAMAELFEVVQHYMAERPSVRLFVHEESFFLETTLLLEESLQLHSLMLELGEREITVIEFRVGLEPQELKHLIEVLNLHVADLQRAGGAAARLEHLGAPHIVVGRTHTIGDHTAPKIVDPNDVYRAALRAVEELNFRASDHLPLQYRKARLVVTSLIESVARDKLALMGMTALKDHDEETCHHSVHVTILSLMIGSQLGLDRASLSTLGLAALFHDIGKVRIDRTLLAKPGEFTPEEREIMKRHTLYGAHLLRELPDQLRLAMVVAFEHHANYDLSGYPSITVKHAPHLLARIVQVADFFDAATSSRRVYRRPMLPGDATRFILENAGKVFDPVVSKVFVQLMGLYPVGSLVELDTGELAVVVSPAEWDVTRPGVKVVSTRAGEKVEPYTVDLGMERERKIVDVWDPVDHGLETTAYL